MAGDDQLKFERTSDFRFVYANNVQFEISRLDLKIVLGITELEQSTKQHTAINITWPEAKLASYFLQVNVAIYEAAVLGGKIQIPKEMWPTPPVPPTPEQEVSNPFAREAFEKVEKLHAAFIASLSENT